MNQTITHIKHSDIIQANKKQCQPIQTWHFSNLDVENTAYSLNSSLTVSWIRGCSELCSNLVVSRLWPRVPRPNKQELNPWAKANTQRSQELLRGGELECRWEQSTEVRLCKGPNPPRRQAPAPVHMGRRIISLSLVLIIAEGFLVVDKRQGRRGGSESLLLF